MECALPLGQVLGAVKEWYVEEGHAKLERRRKRG